MKQLLIILFFAFSVSLSAQTLNYGSHKHEIHISVGDPLIHYFAVGRFPPEKNSEYISTYSWFYPAIKQEKIYWSPALSVSYFYNLSRWFQVGAVSTYFTTFGGQRSDVMTGEKLSYVNYANIGVSPAIRVSYLNLPAVSLYSGFAAGVNVSVASGYNPRKVSISQAFPYIQATFLGVNFGKQVFGNFELGFGMKGLISAGIGYKF